MSKLTAKEIIEKLKNSHISVSDFAHEQIPYLEADQNILDKLKWNTPEYAQAQEIGEKNIQKYMESIPKWEQIAQHGGEGEGDNWWSVKYFPEHDVYLKVTGYYQSHYGTDFSSWDDAVKEVAPKQKTITIYE